MKRSGRRTALHIYTIFLFTLLGTILVAAVLFFALITVKGPDGAIKRSDWPVRFAEDFEKRIVFVNDTVQIVQPGMESLQDNGVGLTILDESGAAVFEYQPVHADNTDVNLTTSFERRMVHNGSGYTYTLSFPMNISKVTMYLNGDRFAGGKFMMLPVFCVLFFAVLVSGLVYGLWTANRMVKLMEETQKIAGRRYLPVHNHGVFEDLYDSLNVLDAEIRASDRLREQTDRMREEWIANITHDLKTPLSPIKGYAEILGEDAAVSSEQRRRYAGIMLKNAASMESLIDDLKLTYQLDNNMVPIHRKEQDIIRFLRELAIDILNIPEYERRRIHFESGIESILYPFDEALLTRVFRNLILNAFVHGEESTEVALQVMAMEGGALKIVVADDGRGMTAEESERLFERYYRGTDQKSEGTGLGLAIAKSIVELHGGSISASSVPGAGTEFVIYLPDN